LNEGLKRSGHQPIIITGKRKIQTALTLFQARKKVRKECYGEIKKHELAKHKRGASGWLLTEEDISRRLRKGFIKRKRTGEDELRKGERKKELVQAGK